MQRFCRADYDVSFVGPRLVANLDEEGSLPGALPAHDEQALVLVGLLFAGTGRRRFDTGATETSRKVAIGGELMITKDFWWIVTIGGQGGQRNGNNSPFVLTGLKFGSASESTGAFGNTNATAQRN